MIINGAFVFPAIGKNKLAELFARQAFQSSENSLRCFSMRRLLTTFLMFFLAGSLSVQAGSDRLLQSLTPSGYVNDCALCRKIGLND